MFAFFRREYPFFISLRDGHNRVNTGSTGAIHDSLRDFFSCGKYNFFAAISRRMLYNY